MSAPRQWVLRRDPQTGRVVGWETDPAEIASAEKRWSAFMRNADAKTQVSEERLREILA